MGKTDLKTAWSPISSRFSAATSFWRNCSYDCCWISMRFGISTIDGILLKSFRTLRPHAIVPAIHPPRPGRWGLRSTHAGRAGTMSALPTRRVRSRGDPYAGPRSRVEEAGGLLHFHGRTDLLELLLHVRRLGLSDLLLYGLGRPVDEVLGFLEAETRQ